MRAAGWAIAALVSGGVASAPVVAYSEREPAPATPAPQQAVDDTASLRRLLSAVRGASPFFCEVVTRNVDGRVWWSVSGSGSLIEFDSSSAALMRWVQTEHRDQRFVPTLAAAMRDPDVCVRRIAGSFLGRVQHASAINALVAALGDANAHTRAVAAIGLGMAESIGGIQALIERLKDPSADVRRSAAWALGAIENKAAMEPLIELLNRDTDARVRQAAAWAIGRVTG